MVWNDFVNVDTYIVNGVHYTGVTQTGDALFSPFCMARDPYSQHIQNTLLHVKTTESKLTIEFDQKPKNKHRKTIKV